MSNRARPLPPLSLLRRELNYDPATGLFTHAYTALNRHKIEGLSAGSLHKDGYVIICVWDHRYKAHRVAWKMHYGVEPPPEIDHEDRVKHHNWIANLREATTSQNCGNANLSKRNSSGFKGVSFHKRCGSWRAMIRYQGKLRHLGVFATPELAHVAYCAAAQELFGEFASAGSVIDAASLSCKSPSSSERALASP